MEIKKGQIELPDVATARAELEKAKAELAWFLDRDWTAWERHTHVYRTRLSDRHAAVRAWHRHLDLATLRRVSA